MCTHRWDLLGVATQDRLHQPYRQVMFPAMERIFQAARDAGAYGAFLSGAARLLAKVIKRTPVGQYEESTGVTGGTLRRGWTAETEEAAKSGGSSDAKAYVDSLQITKIGNVYQIEIINPVFYASYVEYGHRTLDHKGWVEGRFMLTISEKELDTQAPSILEKKLLKYLEECFDGK
jgi:hypothetical protein